MNKKISKNKQYKKSNIIFSLLIFFYLIVHLIDFIYIYYLYLLVYEFIVNILLVWLKYIWIMVRTYLPYIVVYLGFFISYIIFFKHKLFIYNKTINSEKTAYIVFWIKEKSNYIILLVHLLFLGVVFYFELHYSSVTWLIGFCGVIFLLLSLYIKKLLKENDITGSKKINLLVNCLLIIVMGVFLSLLGEWINDNIYFKNNLSEYFYKVIQHKNRLLLKYKRDIYGYWSKYTVGLKRNLITERYNYFKNNILNKKVLADISYNKLKYALYKKQQMHKNNYNKVIKNTALNKYQIKKDNILLFNDFENNVSAQVNKQAVWNEIVSDNNKRLFEALTPVQFKKEFLNIKLHLYNVYKLHWTYFFATEGEIKKMKFLFKNALKKDYYYKFAKQNKYKYSYYKVKVIKSKNCNKNFKLIKKGVLNKVNTKTKLCYLYRMDLNNLLNKKEKLSGLLLKEKTNNLKKYIKPVVETQKIKYSKLRHIIMQVRSFKAKILKLDFNTVSYLTYKYNNFIVWWDKKFNIIQLLGRYKSNYIKAKTLIIKLPKKVQHYYSYMRLKKKLPIHVLRIKSSKAYMYDKKRLLLEWYKPYTKYPKYIFKHKITYYEKQLKTVRNFNTKYKLILGFRHNNKWYEHKQFQNILWFIDWLGLYKRKHYFVVNTKDLNKILFFEDNKIYTVKGQHGHWSTILEDNTKKEKTDTVRGYWDKKGNWVYKRDVIKQVSEKPVSKLNLYLGYFKRSTIYEYLLLKHNSGVWAKYIKWMTAKYTKVMKWGSRLYKSFYKGNNNNNNMYNKYIEEHFLNNINNYNREVEKHFLLFLKQGKSDYDVASAYVDALNFLYCNIGLKYNFFDFLEEFKNYVINKNLRYNNKTNILLNDKKFLDKNIFWDEYMRITEHNIMLEEMRQLQVENDLHNKTVVAIILDYAPWLRNPFAEFSDIIDYEKSNVRYKFAESYFNSMDADLDQALVNFDMAEFQITDAWLQYKEEMVALGQEAAAKMNKEARDFNMYRRLALNRLDVTLDNIYETLLTHELYDQDPRMYYTIAIALDFTDEMIVWLKNEIEMQEICSRIIVTLDMLYENQYAYIEHANSLEFAIEWLNMVLYDEIEPLIEHDLDLNFHYLHDIQDTLNETNSLLESKRFSDTNKVYWETKPKYTEKQELYNNLEKYLINKDWESYHYKRYKEEFFSFKQFKKK